MTTERIRFQRSSSLPDDGGYTINYHPRYSFDELCDALCSAVRTFSSSTTTLALFECTKQCTVAQVEVAHDVSDACLRDIFTLAFDAPKHHPAYIGIDLSTSRITIAADHIRADATSKRLDEIVSNHEKYDLLTNKGAVCDARGYVTLYHRTSVEAGRSIARSQTMSNREGRIFFTTHAHGIHSKDYGDTVIRFLIPLSKLHIEDIFDDEVHVSVTSRSDRFLDIEDYLDAISYPDDTNDAAW